MTGVEEGATPLMYACQQSQEKQVLDLLNRKPSSARETDRTKKTPLHYCAENFNTNCAEALLRVAPDILNARDDDGYSPVHLAVIAGNKPLIQLLLSRGADVNALDHEGHSVVHWATVCGEQEALEMVLRAGANISTADMHGGYPLHYAAQMCGPGANMRGDSRAALNILRTLLAFGADVDERDKDGRQPILWAASADSQSRDPGARFASSGSAEAILTLVKAGAKVEAADKDGLTALHCAASRGHTDCLETLVALCGAYVDTIDVNGCTALFYATTLGHADATQLLLNLGAEPNRQDRKGRTPAHCGAAKGQLETLRLLLAGGANLWLRNVKGDLTLHEAVASGRRELVSWLLNQRPEAVNVANNDGKCPIHVAAINNNIDMVKILLDAGSMVNPVLRSNKGAMMTPLDASLHRGHRSCAKFLQLHGGVPRSKLSDAAAALKGSAPNREMPLDELNTERSTLHRLPAHVTYTASPHVFDSQMQIRLGENDSAIQHIERIDVPICHHHYEIESSDQECRHRRRRRRRRSERRRGDSAAEEFSNDDDACHDSNTRPHRKLSRRRTSDEADKKPRKRSNDHVSMKHSKRNGESEESTQESDAFEVQRESADLSEDDSPAVRNRKLKEKIEHRSRSIKREPEVKPAESKTSKVSARKDTSTKSKKSKGTKNGGNNVTNNGKGNIDDLTNKEKQKLDSNDALEALNPALKKSQSVSNNKGDDEVPPPFGTQQPNTDINSDPAIKTNSHSIVKNNENILSKTSDGENGKEQAPVTSGNDVASELKSKKSTSSESSPRSEHHNSDQEEEAMDQENVKSTESKTQVHEEKVTTPSPALLDHYSVPMLEMPPPVPSDSSLEEINKMTAPLHTTIEVKASVHRSAIETDEEMGIKNTQDQNISGEASSESTDIVAGEEITLPKDTPNVITLTHTTKDAEEGDAEKVTSEDSPATSPTRVSTARKRSIGGEKGLIGIVAEDVDLNSRRSEISGVGEEMSIKIGGRRQSVGFGEVIGRGEMDEMVSELRRKGRRKSEGESLSFERRRRSSLFMRSESEEREEEALRMADVDTVIKEVALDDTEGRSASLGDDSGGSTRHEDSSVLPDSGIEPSPRHERRTPTASPRRRVPRLCRKGRNSEQPVAPVSVTRAVQNTIRKYHLERKIFYQLLELKRLQIRAGRANEQILVKRLVDEYQHACQIAGLQQYSGLYSFKQFERFLYDQLHTLQAGAQIVIPQLKPNDDIETLSTILKRTRVELLDDALDNPILCTRGTHRCHHAAHAYTGVPCAAYITKLNHHTMPKEKRTGFLPFIEPSTNSRPSSRRGRAADRPVTLELVHGRDKQVISLPTDRLDRSKRYYVTFTIKGGDPTPPKSDSPAGEPNIQHQPAQSLN